MRIRAIEEGDREAVGRVLDGAYGPGLGLVDRLWRYRSIDRRTWLAAEAGGEVAGVAGALDYGALAYVGLVGVAPHAQRRGIAHALMERLLDLLEGRGRGTVLLDASDAGAPLYRRLGFVEDDRVRLFVAEAPAAGASTRARAMREGDLGGVAELDRRVGGADRGPLLRSYFDDFAARAFVVEGGEGIEGFAFAQRRGVGPWVAEGDEAAAAVLDAALGCAFDGPVTIAVPGANAPAARLLEARGFAATRSLAHMRLGPPADRDRPRIYGQASLAAG